MDESHEHLLRAIRHYQQGLDKYTENRNDAKLLHYLDRLGKLPVKVIHLEQTGVGKTVNALRKLGGNVGDSAKVLVSVWRDMVVGEVQSEEEEDDDDEQEDGYQSGGDMSESGDSRSPDVQVEKTHGSNTSSQKISEHRPDKKQQHNNSKLDETKGKKWSSSSCHPQSDSRHSSKKDKSHEHHSKSHSNHSHRKSEHHKERSDSEEESTSNKIYSKSKSDSKETKLQKKRKSEDDSDDGCSKLKKIKPDNGSEKVKHKHKHKDTANAEKERTKKSDSSKDNKKYSSKHSSSGSNSSKSGKDHSKDIEKRMNNSSSSSKSKSDKTKMKSHKSVELTGTGMGIASGSGASFAEALGMCEPSSSKAATKKKSTTATSTTTSIPYEKKEKTDKAVTKSDETVPKLLKESNLEPIDLNLSSLLPTITPNYRPLGNVIPLDGQLKRNYMTESEALCNVMTSKNQRTKVYSGNKTFYGKVPTLFEMCIRILQDNIDALEYTGGVPYSVLKPILDKANPNQLFVLEHHNPYLIEDTDDLWQFHCQKDFRGKPREELESWREMYMRCLDEREAKLKALTANIKQAQDKSLPVRTTKLAYVNDVAKPPRNIAKKQAKNGTAFEKRMTPTSKLQSLATAGEAGRIAVPNPGSRASDRSGGHHHQTSKPKKAPLMMKSLSLLKNRFRR